MSDDAGAATQQHHDDRVGPEVLGLRVAAPQPGGPLDGDVPVHVGKAVAFAALIRAGAARVAGAARLEHLDRDPVAAGNTPALRSGIADALDDADRLVVADRQGEPVENQKTAERPRDLLEREERRRSTPV